MLEQVCNEIQGLYQQLAQGLDVSPARRYRLEGKIELLLQQQVISWQALQKQVDDYYQTFLQANVEATFWQWCLEQQQFRLPTKMPIAPVN
jgi:hypothetical protein